MVNKRLNDIYHNMLKRCYKKDFPKYKTYGAVGIKVCKEWKDNRLKFIEWAISSGYKDNLTIDRIDNKKGYCPDNCRWITPKEQARNRSTNKVFNGRCLMEWSEILGFNYHTINRRIQRGMSFEEAIKKPVRKFAYK